MKIFEIDKYTKLVGNTQAAYLYVSECYPIDSTVTIIEDKVGCEYYTTNILKVVGYKVGKLNFEVLLVIDQVLQDNRDPYIHPGNVKLSNKYIRNIQLGKILNV